MLDAVRRSGLPSWAKTQRHARWPFASCAHQTLLPASWKLFCLPASHVAGHRRDRPHDRAAGLVAEAHRQHAALLRPRGVREAGEHPRRQVVAEAGLPVDREQRRAGHGPRRSGRGRGGDGRGEQDERELPHRSQSRLRRLAILEESVSDVLDLLDWKRRVFALYAEIRAADEPSGRGSAGATVRASSSATHPQSPRPGYARARLLPVRPLAPLRRRRRAGRSPSAARSARAATSPSGSRASRPRASTRHELELYWLDAYGGGLFLRSATRPAAARPTAPAATCSTRSRAPTSARSTAGSCSTSTSPTTRRARTTRSGRARSRRPRTGSTCRSAPASGSRLRAVAQVLEDGERRLPLAVDRDQARLPAVRVGAVVEQEPREEVDARVRPRDVVGLPQVLRLLRPAHAEELVGGFVW